MDQSSRTRSLGDVVYVGGAVTVGVVVLAVAKYAVAKAEAIHLVPTLEAIRSPPLQLGTLYK